MKKKPSFAIMIIVIVISIIVITSCSLFLSIKEKEPFDNSFVTFESWWGDDKDSSKFYDMLFDIPEIKNKYDHIKMFSVFGDGPSVKDPKKLYVQFSGESYFNDPYIFDLNFIPVNEKKGYTNTVIFTAASHYLLASGTDLSVFEKQRPVVNNKHFCIFAVSNGSCKERNDFFTSLSKYKKVDSCGKHMNNMGSSCPSHLGSSEYCNFLSQYKFMICFENTSQDNYFTEKLINAYKCNTIPIYWGCSNLDEYINMDAIFYLKPNFTEIDVISLIDDIKRHDEDDELYLKKYNQPLFKNGILPEIFDIDKIREKIKAIIV